MPWGSIPPQGMGPPGQRQANSYQEDALRNANLGLARGNEMLEHSFLGTGALILHRSIMKRVTARFWQFLKIKGTSQMLPSPAHCPSPLVCRSLCLSLDGTLFLRTSKAPNPPPPATSTPIPGWKTAVTPQNTGSIVWNRIHILFQHFL